MFCGGEIVYQTVSSLGSWCQCSHQLRRQNLNVVFTPFDWAFVPLKSILHLISTDFSNYFLRENLSVTRGEYSAVIDSDSGLLTQHYFGRNEQDRVTDAIIDRDYPKLRDPFLRRVDQIRSLLSSPGPHLYVWLAGADWHRGRTAREASRDILGTIRRFHPGHQAHLLTVQLLEYREPDWQEADIFNRYVPAVTEGWIGDDDTWDMIMADFPVAAARVRQADPVS